MARARRPQPVKLFVGLLSGDPDLLRRARQLCSRRYGDVDVESDIWPFDETDYYELEMGPDLKRVFVSFATRIDPARLAHIKLETNQLEAQIADDCLLPEIARPVNIDPGYIDLGKLVLATTKDRAHRVCLDHGIYGEVTLQYTQGGWQAQPWTYPDYRQATYHAFFTSLRTTLLEQRRQDEKAAFDTPSEGAP